MLGQHLKQCINVFQVRDEYRTDFDSGRGGYGKIVQTKIGTVGNGSFNR